VTSECQ